MYKFCNFFTNDYLYVSINLYLAIFLSFTCIHMSERNWFWKDSPCPTTVWYRRRVWINPETTVSLPICSMYGIFTYMTVIFRAHIGKYSSTMFAYGLWNTQKCPIRNTSCTYKSQPFVIFWPEALRPSSAVRSPLFRMFVADRGIHLEEEDFRSIWWYWIHLSPNLRDLSWFTVIYQGRWWSPKYQGIWGYFMFKTMY